MFDSFQITAYVIVSLFVEIVLENDIDILLGGDVEGYKLT